jgi:hypothetical protein
MDEELTHICHECDIQILYPSHATGVDAQCPNCGKMTTLGERYPVNATVAPQNQAEASINPIPKAKNSSEFGLKQWCSLTFLAIFGAANTMNLSRDVFLATMGSPYDITIVVHGLIALACFICIAKLSMRKNYLPIGLAGIAAILLISAFAGYKVFLLSR